VAMENAQFIHYLHMKIPFIGRFSIAMFDYQRGTDMLVVYVSYSLISTVVYMEEVETANH
jgi:hypothetical protein